MGNWLEEAQPQPPDWKLTTETKPSNASPKEVLAYASGYQKIATSKGAGKRWALLLLPSKNEKTAIRKGFQWRLGCLESNVGFGEEL